MLSIFNGFIVLLDISNLSFRARKKTLQSHGLQGFLCAPRISGVSVVTFFCYAYHYFDTNSRILVRVFATVFATESRSYAKKFLIC